MQLSHNAITISKTQIRCAYFHLQRMPYKSVRRKEVKRLTVCIRVSCRIKRKGIIIYHPLKWLSIIEHFPPALCQENHQMIHSWGDPLTSTYFSFVVKHLWKPQITFPTTTEICWFSCCRSCVTAVVVLLFVIIKARSNRIYSAWLLLQ